MKKLFSIRLGSLQAKLLVYLLLVGSIPLVCATVLFYKHSNEYAERELAGHVKMAHEQMLLGVKQAFAEVDRMTRSLAGDYAVQRYMETSPLRELDERAMKEYIDDKLRELPRQLKYVSDLCISMTAPGLMLCTNENGMLPDLVSQAPETLNRNDRLIEPVDAGDRDHPSDMVRYTIPLLDRKTNTSKGYITVLLNMNRLISAVQGKWTVDSHVVFDAKGSVMYRQTGDSAETEAAAALDFGRTEPFTLVRGETIISQNKLDVDGVDWYSRIQVRGQFPFSAFRSLRTTLIIIFASMAVLSLLSSFIFTRIVTGPLHRLRGLMKRAELGDLKAYWLGGGTGEMNDLGESYNQMLNRLEELIKQVKREESLKKEAEIDALQYQLNPHFLYNTLNTIKWVAKLHKTPQISEVVSSLVRLLQASLGKKGDFLEIREEIGLIQDYMEIQHFRYGDKVKMFYEIDPFAASCLVPRMILQPLVENAIIHGIEPSGREGKIHIKAWTERDLLFCQVEDNGTGLTEQTRDMLRETRELKERMSGIGLRHIREKIKLYYGDDGKLYVNGKESEGTTVRLTLPIHRNEG
ncbi:sensor histidine kinase [Paenibacillus thalictri]|nr:sensor histidine kinase [Paenibacillus thalictri]